MNTKTAEEIVYPLTIIPCRYGGCYSGAKFHAFNMEHKSIPEAATGDDVSCAEFWGGLEPSGRHKDYRVNDWGENLFIGSGETPQAAYDNLRKKMGLMMEEYRSQSDKGIEQEKDTIIQQLMEEVERLREEKKEWNEKQRLNYEQKIIEQEETIFSLRSQLSQQPTDIIHPSPIQEEGEKLDRIVYVPIDESEFDRRLYWVEYFDCSGAGYLKKVKLSELMTNRENSKL